MSAYCRDPEISKIINDGNIFNLANSTVNISPTKIFHTACDALPNGCSWKKDGKITNGAISYVIRCLQQNEEIETSQLCECCSESHCLLRIA